MNKSAFTLAEVLIVIGIIGIVAAMTLPSLVGSYKKSELIGKLKKSYTTINQAFQLSEVDNGEFEGWDDPLEIGVYNYSNKYFGKYFKIIKICQDYEKCGYERLYYKASDGSDYKYGTVWSPKGLTFILADGIICQFRVLAVGVDDPNDPNYKVLLVFIDINGSKKPNQLGKDVFMFERLKGGIFPYGINLPESIINSNCKTIGEYCAAKIIKDGWNIDNDYPW